MRVIIVGILVLTLGVAAVSTYLIKSFQTPEALEQLEKEKKVLRTFVLVSAKTLPVGAVITAEDLVWQAWAEDAIHEKYIVNKSAEPEKSRGKLVEPFIGAVTRYPITNGEPILAEKVFRGDTAGFMAGALAPGMRAVTIKVQEHTSAAGFIFPGDRVDVFLTHDQASKVEDIDERKESESVKTALKSVTETILSNKKVLSIGQIVANVEKKQAIVAKTITLEVTPKEAQMMTVARTMGKLSLSLRSLQDAPIDDEEGGGLTFTTDVEVSPYLRSKKAQQAEDEVEEEEETPDFLPSLPSGPVIKVFRGQAQATEEIGGDSGTMGPEETQ